MPEPRHPDKHLVGRRRLCNMLSVRAVGLVSGACFPTMIAPVYAPKAEVILGGTATLGETFGSPKT